MGRNYHVGHRVRCIDLEFVPPMITISAIQWATAAHFGVVLADMKSSKRGIRLSYARNVAMYLSRVLTRESYPSIARDFGGVDHTSVVAAHRRVEGLLHDRDEKAIGDIAEIQRSVQEQAGAEVSLQEYCPHCGQFWIDPVRRKEAVAQLREQVTRALARIEMLEKTA